MPDLGLSFMPTPQGNPQAGGPSPVEPTQEAIKILSLRLPRVLGGGAFSPAPLLNGLGAQGNPFSQNAVGQTQQRLLPQPTGLSAAPSAGSVTGAISPGFGGLSPDLLLRVLQLLAGPGLGGSGLNTPSPSRVIPELMPGEPSPGTYHPIPEEPPLPPPDITVNPSPSQPPSASTPAPVGGGGRWPWTPRGPASF